MIKPDHPSHSTSHMRWLIAGAIALGLSAAPLVGTYAAPGDPTGTPAPGTSPATTTTTTSPVATSTPATTVKPIATAAPTAAPNPPVLKATYDTRPFTCDNGLCDHSNITVYVPNAPDTAWIGVQWLDSTGPTWKDVEGWQGNLDIAPNTGQPLKQWTVFHTNFGQGPFRWVIKTSQNGAVWGISPEFKLPAIGGLNVLMFLSMPANMPAVQLPATNPVSLISAPMLTTSSIVTPFGCSSPCDESNIAIYVPNAPSTAWVGIQWLDSNGLWHDVPGWQGNLDMASNSTTPFKQWTVFHSQLGKGPFHWVIYTQKGGSIMGVSPNFTLPHNGGELLSTFVSPAG